MIAKTNLNKLVLLKEGLLLKTLLLSGVSLLSNSVGFLVPIYIGYKYTITKETDSFFLSYSIIVFVNTIFAFAVRGVAVPFLKQKLGNKDEFNTFVSTVSFYITKYIGGASLLVIIITIAVSFISKNPLWIYLAIGAPIIVLTTLSSFFYGVMNSLDKFYGVELTQLLRAVTVLIIIYLFSGVIGMTAAIVGYTLGELFRCIQLYYIVRYNGILITTNILDFSLIKTFVKQGSNQIISTTLVSTNPLIDRFIASFLIAGSISILDYGDKVFMIFNVLLNSFLVLLLSKWSTEVLKNEFNINKLHNAMFVVFIATLVAFFVISLVKTEFLLIVYPNFSEAEREVISKILMISLLGFIFNSVSQVVNRASIVLKHTKIMITTSIVRVIFNVVLNILFAIKWGVIGIAMSSACVHVIALGTNYFLFKQKYTAINRF